MRVIEVEPGTVITNDKGGELTVTEDQMVLKGSTIYVTAGQYEEIKKAIPSASEIGKH